MSVTIDDGYGLGWVEVANFGLEWFFRRIGLRSLKTSYLLSMVQSQYYMASITLVNICKGVSSYLITWLLFKARYASE